MEKRYIAIDLKSFYASVECVERGLDPLDANLVVADISRTEKTICLAVTPNLKSYGIPGRARLFEVIQKLKDVNKQRLKGKEPSKKAYGKKELCEGDEIAYIAAVPRMALYIEYSKRIYDIYLKYISKDDMHVYSVDEVFIDATAYLKTYGMTTEELAKTIVADVYNTTGITATAGIGTNLYLSKIAMDIIAKHSPPDENGVRMGYLDEDIYKKTLWSHKPITDFWRVGAGYARKLAQNGMYTMGDVARCSVYDEELLYKLFGINAELLIDHAWGVEGCTIAHIKAYRPENSSISEGQVLSCPTEFKTARLILWEMADNLSLELTRKRLCTNQIVISVGFDSINIKNGYKGETVKDRYSKLVPPPLHKSANIEIFTCSSSLITKTALKIFDTIEDKTLFIRRLNVVANHVTYEDNLPKSPEYEQMSIFSTEEKGTIDTVKLQKEKQIQKAVIKIKDKYGKNSLLKASNYKEGATAISRNSQIGGHKA
ncbi:MAG: DNA methylase [Firmicutes bacterium]|nr:DNA methylase [Bacillota bacterium]